MDPFAMRMIKYHSAFQGESYLIVKVFHKCCKGQCQIVDFF